MATGRQDSDAEGHVFFSTKEVQMHENQKSSIASQPNELDSKEIKNKSASRELKATNDEKPENSAAGCSTKGGSCIKGSSNLQVFIQIIKTYWKY